MTRLCRMFLHCFSLCLFHLLSFDSLPFKQSDFGMDVGGSSQPNAPAAPAAAQRMSSRRSRVSRSRNDQRMITWMRQHIIDLEKLMKTKQAELDKLKARPAPSTERELYLLSEIELMSRQLDNEYLEICYPFRTCL